MPTLARDPERMEDEDLEDDDDEDDENETTGPQRGQNWGSQRPSSLNKSVSKGQKSKVRPGSSSRILSPETVECCYLFP